MSEMCHTVPTLSAYHHHLSIYSGSGTWGPPTAPQTSSPWRRSAAPRRASRPPSRPPSCSPNPPQTTTHLDTQGKETNVKDDRSSRTRLSNQHILTELTVSIDADASTTFSCSCSDNEPYGEGGGSSIISAASVVPNLGHRLAVPPKVFPEKAGSPAHAQSTNMCRCAQACICRHAARTRSMHASARGRLPARPKRHHSQLRRSGSNGNGWPPAGCGDLYCSIP